MLRRERSARLAGARAQAGIETAAGGRELFLDSAVEAERAEAETQGVAVSAGASPAPAAARARRARLRSGLHRA